MKIAFHRQDNKDFMELEFTNDNPNLIYINPCVGQSKPVDYKNLMDHLYDTIKEYYLNKKDL
jgi:hypothetical protein